MRRASLASASVSRVASKSVAASHSIKPAGKGQYRYCPLVNSMMQSWENSWLNLEIVAELFGGNNLFE